MHGYLTTENIFKSLLQIHGFPVIQHHAYCGYDLLKPTHPMRKQKFILLWVPLASSKALQALSKGQGQHSRPWHNSIRDPPLWRILVPLSDQQFQSYIGVYIHTFWPHSQNKKVRWGTEIFTCTKTETYIFLSSKVDRTKAGQHIHHLFSI